MSLPPLHLVDHFLIAMPSIRDPIFGSTVIYICEHTTQGALGMIVNKPTDMTMGALLKRIDVSLDASLDLSDVKEQRVVFGGPVQDNRGFVLHVPTEKAYSSTITINHHISFTTSVDVLQAVAEGRGPGQLLVSIGYSGWGAGQLEEEVMKNGWLTVAADPTILFNVPIEQRYSAALKLLDIDMVKLSGEIGHA